MVKRQSNKIIDFFAMGAKRSKVGDQDDEEKEEIRASVGSFFVVKDTIYKT